MLEAITEYFLGIPTMRKVNRELLVVRQLADRHMLSDRQKRELQEVNRAAALNFTLYAIPKIIVNLNTLGTAIGMACGLDADLGLKVLVTGEVLRAGAQIVYETKVTQPADYYDKFYREHGLAERAAKIREELPKTI